MRPSRRQAGGAADPLRGEGLEYAERAARKPDRAEAEIEDPQPCLHTANLAFRLCPVGRQAIVPEPRRTGIMLAPCLDIVHLESIALKIRDRHPKVIEFSAG